LSLRRIAFDETQQVIHPPKIPRLAVTVGPL
jgi:hypothetical protein